MLEIRPIADGDSIAELTELLHRSYKRLGDMGLRFFATHQTEAQTRERIESGKCFVGECDGRVVGTIALYSTHGDSGPSWYERDDVAFFGQFAVDPEYQGRGFGNMLLDHVEATARANGMSELACDTAETASHLIDYYSRHGFRIVDTTQWHDTNYRSVVMSKSL